MLRQKIQKNKVGIGIISGLVILVSVIRLSAVASPPPAAKPMPTSSYYYDLASGQVFPGPSNDYPPIAAPSDKDKTNKVGGVRAYIYACGSCSDSGNKLAYIERFNPEAQKYMRENMNDPEARIGPIMQHVNEIKLGHMVAQPIAGLDAQWIEASSDEGVAVINTFLKECPPATPAIECRPIPGH